MTPIQRLVGLWRRGLRRLRPIRRPQEVAAAAPSPPIVEPPPQDPVVSSGVVVWDHQVSAQYPGAVRRTIAGLSLLRDGPPEVTINVFEAGRVASTTSFYLPIDLRENRLFVNQTYEHVRLWWPGEPRISGESYSYRSEVTKTITGKAILFGGPVDGNYYHWMMNWLSRLAILRMLRPDLYYDNRVGLVVDEKARRSPFIDFLLASGIHPDRFIWVDGGDLILEDAVLVSFGNRDETCPEVVAAMRELFGSMGPAAAGGRRRLWISRQALGPFRRTVADMQPISAVLQAHGFEDVTLETLPVAEQIGLFKSAEAVVGVHGAGLTNMIFSPPDCRVISIESNMNLKIGASKFYATLAEACGLAYTHLKVTRAPRPPGTEHNFANVHNQDYVVRPQALDAVLRNFLPPREARDGGPGSASHSVA